MRYSHTRAQSAELLRMVLQRMGQHEAGFTPHCYAVWYECLAGANHKLSYDIDERIAEGPPLDDAAIEQLFDKYVSELDVDAARELQAGAHRILDDLARHTAEADSRASEFGSSLEKSANRLVEMPGEDVLGEVVAALQADTGKMRTAVQELSANLQSSREEVDELKRALDKAQIEVQTDPMTGALNRRGFNARLSEMVENAQDGVPLCLLMVDIDHFKKINDTFGHLFGDKVIGAIAATLNANVKGRDAVARLGGEEFGVLLPETGPEGGMVLAEKIRAAIEKARIRQSGKPEPVGGITISLGLTAYIPGEDHETFIHRADQALYASKTAGRNRATLA